jgi:hypothetical protein
MTQSQRATENLSRVVQQQSSEFDKRLERALDGVDEEIARKMADEVLSRTPVMTAPGVTSVARGSTEPAGAEGLGAFMPRTVPGDEQLEPHSGPRRSAWWPLR